MSTQQILLIAIPFGVAILVLFGVVVAASRRESSAELAKDEEQIKAEAALAAVPGGGSGQSMASRPSGKAPAPKAPSIEMKPVREKADPDVIGITRRQILNRGIVLASIAGLAAFGGACLAFLWPRLSGGFGSVVTAGNLNEIKAQIAQTREPYYNPSGRFYLMTYETNMDPAEGNKLYPGIFESFKENGVMAIYQKCAHLGCRVPWCKTSQWFECPCHGSKYNAAGEWTAGPAPRGLWHFPIKVSGGIISVDTGEQVEGPPLGTSTPVNAESKGPHCVGA